MLKIVWPVGLMFLLLLVAHERVAGMPGELPQQPALAGALPAPAAGVSSGELSPELVE